MIEPMAILPSAECTRSMFLPLFAQCQSNGQKSLQMMICSFTTGPCISAKPTSSPHRLITMSPSCSLTLRMDGFSIAIVPTLGQSLLRHLTMTLTLTVPSVYGTFTPLTETQEPPLADRVERRLDTTTSPAMYFQLGKSTALSAETCPPVMEPRRLLLTSPGTQRNQKGSACTIFTGRAGQGRK